VGLGRIVDVISEYDTGSARSERNTRKTRSEHFQHIDGPVKAEHHTAMLAKRRQDAIVQWPGDVAWSFDGHSFTDKPKYLRCEIRYFHRLTGVETTSMLFPLMKPTTTSRLKASPMWRSGRHHLAPIVARRFIAHCGQQFDSRPITSLGTDLSSTLSDYLREEIMFWEQECSSIE
jgi:hypothetical protein